MNTNPLEIKTPGIPPLKKGGKGILLVELMVALGIIVVGIMAMLGSFALFTTMSAKTRNRVYGEMLAKSMMDRIRAHHYGDPEPFNWNSDETVRILPEIDIADSIKSSGKKKDETRVSVVNFSKKVEYKNGSFIGKTADNYDVITITISWFERSPGRQFQKSGEKAKTSAKVTMEVRRNIPDQSE